MCFPMYEKKKRSDGHEGETGSVVPLELVAQIQHGKDREDGQGDYFLNGFELRSVEFVRADAVGGHLETIFEEGDAPAGEDNFPERLIAIFQMAIPGEGHENI